MEKNISVLLNEVQVKTGWSQTRIASLIKTSQPTAGRILAGQSECKLSTWKLIVDLHRKICA